MCALYAIFVICKSNFLFNMSIFKNPVLIICIFALASCSNYIFAQESDRSHVVVGNASSVESIMYNKYKKPDMSFSDWGYKGYIGVTPIYIGGNGFNLGFGAEGEFALPRLLTFRANVSRNYYELDRTAKRSFVTDFGISFHPIEWTGNAKYSNTTVEGAKDISYDGGQTWTDHKDAETKYSNESDNSIQRICFRAGILNYRYNYQYESMYGAPMSQYVESSAGYLGLSYYKVGLSKGIRRQFIADVVFQNSVEVPQNTAMSDTCTLRKGFRLCYVKAGDTGGGSYEIGAFPGLNSKSYIYFRVSLTINAVFVKGFKW